MEAMEQPSDEHGMTHSGVGLEPTAAVPDEAALVRAAEVLNAGQKVAMLVGAGALDATDEVIDAAERLGAGVAKALLGKAVVPDDIPFCTGSIGLLGTKASWELMQGCDTLLMVGSGFPYAEFLPKKGQARGVQIDIKPGMLGLRYPMEVNLVGDAAARWVGRSSSSASSTSRATARRAGGAWSGCSAHSRAACHRSCARRGSPPSRLPTTGSRPSTSRTTTPGSRSRLPRKGRRSCRSWGRSRISYASRKSAWWGTTTRSVTAAACCKSPSSATAATSSRRTCTFTNARTAGSRSSTVRCGSPTMSRTERWLTRSVRPEPLRKSASQQAYGRRGRALLAHPAHRPSAPERTCDVLRRPDIFTCYRQVGRKWVTTKVRSSRGKPVARRKAQTMARSSSLAFQGSLSRGAYPGELIQGSLCGRLEWSWQS